MRVSGPKGSSASRRDSWDVINKTKHILSHNSLESLANMTESQLNTDLSYVRPRGLDSETEYNTRYNKFELSEKRTTERRGSDELSDRYKIYSPSTSVSLKQDSSTHENFSQTIKERNESFTKSEKDNDYGYSSRFRPIEKEEFGAKAIRVQDIPNGVLGRPVEFESESK